MAEFYNSESMQTLINAVNKYQKNLEVNMKLLVDASNVCDATMGSDAISKRHIMEMHEALKTLRLLSDCAKTVATELKVKQMEADEII